MGSILREKLYLYEWVKMPKRAVNNHAYKVKMTDIINCNAPVSTRCVRRAQTKHLQLSFKNSPKKTENMSFCVSEQRIENVADVTTWML
jgi:ssRNA-specific RNase YbeY (16S rRNA maturation enzyme)